MISPSFMLCMTQHVGRSLMFKRKEFEIIRSRLMEPRHFIQVVLGPRQVGKTTTIRQVLATLGKPSLYFSADDVRDAGPQWLSRCWETARIEASRNPDKEIILIIDEVQKVPNWSEVVKKEWDSDSWNERPIKVLLLGSSRALLMAGLSESLMGRFEEIRMTHWSYAEMHEAFGMELDEFMFYGGYPGPAFLLPAEEERWKNTVRNAMVDATIQRDILEDNRIAHAALLRRTLELGIEYSGQILSLTKLLGELQDRGNVSTIAGYLEKLNQSGLLGTLSKYSNDSARQRASIPKLQVHNNALFAAFCRKTIDEARSDPIFWGRCVESAVGAYLLSQSYRKRFEVMYWREGSDEVDFVLRIHGKLIALEVKSNFEKRSRGLDKFCEKFSPYCSLIVGSGGLSLETFFSMDPEELAA